MEKKVMRKILALLMIITILTAASPKVEISSIGY